MIKFLKFLLAIVLLPTVVLAAAETFYLFLPLVGNWKTFLPFLIGIVLYVVLHYRVYNFSRPYVFIHEITHAVAAWLCGYRVSKISVKKDNGFVKMDKTNTFVVLAPYFIPGYVVLTILLYILISLFVSLEPYNNYVLGLIGFLMAFHFIQTFHTLWEADQPDLQLAGGKVFSLVAIVLANLFILACVLKILFPAEVQLLLAGKNVVKGTVTVWRIIVNYIVEHISNSV